MFVYTILSVTWFAALTFEQRLPIAYATASTPTRQHSLQYLKSPAKTIRTTLRRTVYCDACVVFSENKWNSFATERVA